MQTQTQTSSRTVLTQTELQQGLVEGRFLEENGDIQTLNLSNIDVQEGAPVICDLQHAPRNLRDIVIVNCSFPNGLEILEYGKEPRVELRGIGAKFCVASKLRVAVPCSSSIIVEKSQLDFLHIDGNWFKELAIGMSAVNHLSVDIQCFHSSQTFEFEDLRVQRLSIIGGALSREEVRKLKFDFRYGNFDIPDTRSTKPLQVENIIETDIPQLARFFQLLCPTTPIRFTADMRELL